MPGFHPVLGLLAVAVCISPSQGAPFPAITNYDITAQKYHNAKLDIAVQTGIDGDQLQRTLYNNKKDLAKRDDSQNTNVIDERNLKNNDESAGPAKVINLRSKDTDAVRTHAKGRESGSGGLDEATRESDRVLTRSQESESKESASDSEESGTGVSNESVGSGLGSQISNSESEEECDEKESNGASDGKVTDRSTVPLSPTTTPKEKDETTKATDEDAVPPSPTETPGEDNEGCEDSEPTPESSTPESPVSSPTSPEEPNSTSQQSQESPGDEECGDDEPTPTTKSTQRRTSTTSRPTRKTQDPNNSSGSFNDSDPDGVEFSNSNSLESGGTSTDLSDK